MVAVQGFEKHLVFYRPTEAGIEIVRVLHAARDIAAVLAGKGREFDSAQTDRPVGQLSSPPRHSPERQRPRLQALLGQRRSAPPRGRG